MLEHCRVICGTIANMYDKMKDVTLIVASINAACAPSCSFGSIPVGQLKPEAIYDAPITP